jgi:serine/threonine-protein kinase SRPK3
MVFELVTGDYLFDPKKGKTYRKNDDHLALMSEIIGPCQNKNWLETNPKVWKFYNKKNYKLKNIAKLHEWPMYKVLLEKYRLKDSEARSLSEFLLCMLKWKPKDRSSARDLLDHPWMKEQDDYSVWMSKQHLKEYKLVNRNKFPGYVEQLRKEIQDEAIKEQKNKLKQL